MRALSLEATAVVACPDMIQNREQSLNETANTRLTVYIS